MNHSNVLSILADEDMNEHLIVKKTATGVALADSADKAFGVNLRPIDQDVVGERIASVALIGYGSHYVTMGDGTDIAEGDEIELSNNGTIVKKNAGTAIGIALEAGTIVGQQIRAVLY
jgi:hypothetical protein